MKYEDLKLTKEEVGVNYLGSSEPALKIPIHPKLLSKKLDPKIPMIAFEQAVGEFYGDLNALANSGNYASESVNHWREIFLKGEPQLDTDYGQLVMKLPRGGTWESEHHLAENGFMYGLSISRNGGGSLYFNKNEFNCDSSLKVGPSRSPLQLLNMEKASEFSYDTIHSERGPLFRMYHYATHNIDYIPGALMLRNWALAYMNEALKSIAD